MHGILWDIQLYMAYTPAKIRGTSSREVVLRWEEPGRQLSICRSHQQHMGLFENGYP